MRLAMFENALHKRLWVCLVLFLFIGLLGGCTPPEEKAKKFYEKGMQLLQDAPEKAKLEFQNALQLRPNMTDAIYGLALVAEKQADWKTAFGLLKTVIEENPNHVDALVKIGQIYLAAGEIEQARQHADKAIGLDAQNIGAILLKAALELKAGQSEAAVKRANLVLEREPNNVEAYLILASDLHAKNDTDGALSFLEKVLIIDPSNRAAHLMQIGMLSAGDDKIKAMQAWDRMLKVFPEDRTLREKYAEFLYVKGEPQRAEEQYRSIIKQNASDIEAKMELIRFLLNSQGEAAAKSEFKAMLEQNPEDYELRYHLVEFYESLDDKVAAQSELEKIINYAGNKPEGLKAKTKVASRMLLQNNRSGAIKLIQEVLSADGKNNDALIVKASIALDDMRFEEAISDLRTVIADNPDSAQAQLLIAKAYDAKGSTSLAEESYFKALDASKYNPQYALQYAEYLLRKKETDRAEKILNDALKRHPDNIAVTAMLAEIKLTKGDVDGASEIARHIQGATNSNLADLIQGAILARKKDFTGALQAFKQAHTKMPDDIHAMGLIVKTLLTNKQYKDAEQFLKEILLSKPNDEDIRYMLAEVYEASRQPRLEEAELKAIITLKPTAFHAYNNLASLYVREKQFQKAIEILNQGLAQMPDDINLKLSLAEVYQYSKDYSAALNIYQSIMRDYPAEMVAVNNFVSIIADSSSDKSKIEEAYKLAQRLKHSNEAQFIDTYGWIAFRNGQLDEALDYLRLATEKAPDIAIFQYHLGKVYLSLQKKAEAKASLEKAIALSENNQDVNLEEIRTLLKTL